MGGVNSTEPCCQPLNPDILSVITLSDSAVSRLPLETDDSPLEKEARNRNVDQFWRERLECLDKTHAEDQKITDKEFARLEYAIKNSCKSGSGKPICQRGLEDTRNCYSAYSKEPLICAEVIEKLQLCLDTLVQESTKKRYIESQKKNKKKKCLRL